MTIVRHKRKDIDSIESSYAVTRSLNVVLPMAAACSHDSDLHCPHSPSYHLQTARFAPNRHKQQYLRKKQRQNYFSNCHTRNAFLRSSACSCSCCAWRSASSRPFATSLHKRQSNKKSTAGENKHSYAEFCCNTSRAREARAFLRENTEQLTNLF